MTISITFHFIKVTFGSIIPELPISIPAFLGTAISVILSFKLNQSYDRWWEARKIWGGIVNDSRTFVIQLQMFLSKGNESSIKKIAYRQVAWCYCLGQSLRGLDPLGNLEKFLSSRTSKSRITSRTFTRSSSDSRRRAARVPGCRLDRNGSAARWTSSTSRRSRRRASSKAAR